MAMKTVICGRAHSGKNRLAELLEGRFGMKVLKTCTDRPKRWPEEDTYHFYTKEETARIPQEEKLFYTERVDGYARWADKSEFLEADVAILDPPGCAEAVRVWQANGHLVKSVYILAGAGDRKANWIRDIVENGGIEAEAVALFDEREKIEAPMFRQLEDMIENEERIAAADAVLYPNFNREPMHLFHADTTEVWKNPFDPDRMQEFAGRIGRAHLAAGSRAGGFRKFWNREDLILEPEDWTRSEWAALMKMLGLEPDVTVRAAVKASAIECYVDPEAENKYKDG